MKKNILIVAGETSGDIHGANLIDNLKKLRPGIFFFGIGGQRMEAQGVSLVSNIEKLSIIGIAEIFSKAGHVYSAYKKVMQKVRNVRPDLAILIDYPGFNLRLARSLKKRGIPVIYYITPQVWAWGKSRIYTIKKNIDKALVILKFEERLFRSFGIDATFVGHPLLDRGEAFGQISKKHSESDRKRFTIALLPGSRESEVKRMLPVMLKTADIIVKQKHARFLLLKSSGVSEKIYRSILHKSLVKIDSLKDDTHGCLSQSDFIFTSSGTATLESAIVERPMLIIYKTSFLTALIFKLFANTRDIGLVNIIAGKRVAPEVLQYDATPKNLAKRILSIISSKSALEKQTSELKKVKNSLGTPGASLRAARIINDFLK